MNGTSGYEEAAGQGLIAGANAALGAGGGTESLVVGRLGGYLGLMIADLTELGVDEPYRMLTARAANRLELRSSSAPERLTPVGRSLGLVGAEQWAWFERRTAALALVEEWVGEARVEEALRSRWPGGEWGPCPQKGVDLEGVLHRPHVETIQALRLADAPESVLGAASDPFVCGELVARFRYEGYLERERVRLGKAESPPLIGMDYSAIQGLRAEAVERLSKAQPASVAEARLLRGVTAADIDALLVHCSRSEAAEGRRGAV